MVQVRYMTARPVSAARSPAQGIGADGVVERMIELIGLGVVEHDLPKGRVQAEQGCGRAIDVVLYPGAGRAVVGL